MKKSAGPYLPVDYTAREASAIQALMNGDATPDQQKYVLDWVINVVAGTYDQSFYPGEEGRRNTDFAEGRRFVGNTLVKMTRVNVSTLRRKEES